MLSVDRATSGYLFPAPQGPVYTMGISTCLALGATGMALTTLYIFLCVSANRSRDRREGRVLPGQIVDTAAHGDKAPGLDIFGNLASRLKAMHQ